MLVLVNLDCADTRRARMTSQLVAQGIAFDRIGHDFRGIGRRPYAKPLRLHFQDFEGLVCRKHANDVALC